jgi:hypothetical protein
MTRGVRKLVARNDPDLETDQEYRRMGRDCTPTKARGTSLANPAVCRNKHLSTGKDTCHQVLPDRNEAILRVEHPAMKKKSARKPVRRPSWGSVRMPPTNHRRRVDTTGRRAAYCRRQPMFLIAFDAELCATHTDRNARASELETNFRASQRSR